MQHSETETPTPTLGTSDKYATANGRPVRLRTCLNAWHSSSVDLRLEDLQAIVQQAYDQHGILAQPWTATPPECNATGHCAADRHMRHCPVGRKVLEVAL